LENLAVVFSQDALTVSAPDISQDFAERRNEGYRRDVTVDVQLKSALSDWSQAVRDDQRHNALGKKDQSRWHLGGND
jgi:hypothetical protein